MRARGAQFQTALSDKIALFQKLDLFLNLFAKAKGKRQKGKRQKVKCIGVAMQKNKTSNLKQNKLET